MPQTRRPRPIIAPKLHHATFLTLKLDEMVTWYETVCGLTPVHYSDGAAWLTNDEANHRIALIAHPKTKKPTDKPTSAGLHHTAFEYVEFDQWLDNYVRLRDEGIVPFMSLDHGVTVSMYYADPEERGGDPGRRVRRLERVQGMDVGFARIQREPHRGVLRA